MRDLQSSVRHETQERALSNTQVGKVNFMTMLDQFHNNLDLNNNKKYFFRYRRLQKGF